MDSKTFRLVILVSCCHALVHVYELSFASVEQLVADDFGVTTRMTGVLGTSLRMPFGLGAFFAGWLAGRYGAKRLLVIYLCGCSLAAGLAGIVPTLAWMFVAMFTLGSFASIYHPSGLGLISRHTTPENRPMALGYHGIFGSAGIATAPFLAGFILQGGATWHQFYLLLTIPGLLLATLLMFRLRHHHERSQTGPTPGKSSDGEDDAHWGSYFTLLGVAATAGLVYHGVLNFLPRYLGEAGLSFAGTKAIAGHNYLAGMVLSLGILGQYTAGRIARPKTLEPILAMSLLGSAGALFWMGLATGPMRIVAAGVFAPLFFSHQPVFNSLIAKYVPRGRRSMAYGVSFTVGFGFGSLGSTFSGWANDNDLLNYTTLSLLLCLAMVFALVLRRQHLPGRADADDSADSSDE